jgi:pimeloyl-ACP methyl ester carboxylesterase
VDTIEPLHLAVPEADLEDLRTRLRRTRWPEPATSPGWAQGVPLDRLRAVCTTWAEDYDWRRIEARLNAIGQFRTTIDGLDIHFLHARSPHPDALPVVMTHGWPGSVVEFVAVVDGLTRPEDPADAFHLVCPSLPGYGFSDKPAATGWGVERTARAWATLMARLGYRRYGAQGSDWGTTVTTEIAKIDAEHLVGIHVIPPLVAPDRHPPGGLTDAERAALAKLDHHGAQDGGYSLLHRTKPQTIGYALTDSPAALCAWIYEKYASWMDCDGDPETVVTREALLDNVMLYWLPGTGASAARLYWESLQKVDAVLSGETPDPVGVPTACSVFPAELQLSSRRWAERRFTDIRHWGEPPRGGHFAAFEQPAVFVGEMRAAFRALRSA